jgi:hypothetical protein
LQRRRGRRRKGSPDRNKNNTARFIPKPCLKINELIGTAVQSILHTCSLFLLHRYTFTSLVSPLTPSYALLFTTAKYAGRKYRTENEITVGEKK